MNEKLETGREEEEVKEKPEPEAGTAEQPKKKSLRLRNLFYDLVIAAASCVLVFAVYKLINVYRDYGRSAKLYENVSNRYVFDPNAEGGSYNRGQSIMAQNLPGRETAESHYVPADRGDRPKELEERVEWYERIGVNLNGLKKENDDVIGWIYFEEIDISYPVLYSGDNDYYLRRSMDKQYANAGSIFVEGLNQPDFEDNRTIIYGHNMDNESMFGKLKYLMDAGYYKDHSYFQIFVDNKVYRYQIFSCFIVDQYALEFYEVPYADRTEYQSFIDILKSMSYLDTGVSVTSKDKVITLSTCSNGSENRLLVNAVRVDEHFSNTTGRISDLTIE